MRQVSQFMLSDVLRTSLSIYVRNLPAVVVLAVVLAVVWHVLWAAFVAGHVPHFGLGFISPLYAMVFFGIFWSEGAMTFVVVRALGARPPTWGELLAQTVRAIPRMFVVAAIVALGPVALVVLAFISLADPSPFAMSVVVALCVPIVILTQVSWVAVPVAGVERGGVWRALKRSHDLTNGRKGGLFAIRLLINFSFWYAGVVATTISWWAPVVVAAAGFSALGTVVAVCYHDLRMLKGGADDTGRLADVSA